VPNLFTRDDAVKAKVIADLRAQGLSFQRLAETALELDSNQSAVNTGALVLVNGTVSVADHDEAAATINKEAVTLVYNTRHALLSIDETLARIGG
jgi:hypothetical protein